MPHARTLYAEHRREKNIRRVRLAADREAHFEALREYLDVPPAERAAHHVDLGRRLRALGHDRAIAAAERLEAQATDLRRTS